MALSVLAYNICEGGGERVEMLAGRDPRRPRRRRRSQRGHSRPAPAPWLRIDYVFAAAAAADRLQACDIVATEKAQTASDHLPVVARFG